VTRRLAAGFLAACALAACGRMGPPVRSTPAPPSAPTAPAAPEPAPDEESEEPQP
jgi:hypothetical protein